ncbi:bis(5'-nucleosyl)-tetraphosphatase [asymmetrical]-like [Rhopilema esculentum]|uniref:bis(5'-nucleosyl)-tetraphosphatase [asymmetrical]-like n=1 Tax=Rhopilema esculentum TaxID=499914 RepID=UPI0031CE93B6|eukprot:gene6471-11924_t
MASEVKAVGIIIFRCLTKNNTFQYLLLRHSYGEKHWTPPKGHVDPGEDEITAAIRETQEECGLGPKEYTFVDGFKHTLFYQAWGRNKAVHYWLAKVNDNDCTIKLSHEHQDFKWLALSDACDLVGYKDTQSLLMTAESFLLKEK